MRKPAPFYCTIYSLGLLLVLGCKKEAVLEPSSPQLIEIKNFGGSGVEQAVDMLLTQDGGLLVVANTQSTDGDLSNKSGNDNDAWVMKLNAALEVEWQHTYGDELNNIANKILQEPDGGWVILGATQQPVQANKGTDVWLLKLDTGGTVQWEKTYGFLGIDIGYDGIATADGGFLLAASLDVTASGGAGNQSARAKRHAGGDYWLVKINASGELVWSQYYGGFFTETPCCVVEHPDGGYLLAGTSDSVDVDISENLGSYDIWLVRVDAEGQLLWEKNYGGQQIDSAGALLALNDGSFIVVGTTRSTDQNVEANKGAADVWTLKLNSTGAILWAKNYGGSNFDTALSASLNTTNQILIAGNSRSEDGDLRVNNGHNDAWMLTLDTNGNIVQQFTWGGSQTDTFNAVTETTNKSIFLLGTTNSPNIGNSKNYGFTDVFITKMSK